MHKVAVGEFGIPQNSRDAFDILSTERLITPQCAEAMKNMLGFRNTAVHDYQRIQLEIITSILDQNLEDFKTYLKLLSD